MQVLWPGLAYGTVLTVQLHPGIGSAGQSAEMWVIVVTTAIAIGVLMRRFSYQIRDDDRRFEFAFSDSPIGAGFLSRDLVCSR